MTQFVISNPFFQIIQKSNLHKIAIYSKIAPQNESFEVLFIRTVILSYENYHGAYLLPQNNRDSHFQICFLSPFHCIPFGRNRAHRKLTTKKLCDKQSVFTPCQCTALIESGSMSEGKKTNFQFRDSFRSDL